MDFKTGGQRVIERLVEAYGFTTRQALCDHLGVSKSTLATRYMRDLFPAEWVVQCALETGASLRWLTSGSGPIFEIQSDIESVPKKKIIDSKLFDAGFYLFDKSLLNKKIEKSAAIIFGSDIYVIDTEDKDIRDGLWLVDIDSNISLRNIVLLPKSRIKVESSTSSFECAQEDVIYLGRVKLILTSID